MNKKIFAIIMMALVWVIYVSCGVNSYAVSEGFYSKANAYGFNISIDYEPGYMDDFKER